MWPKGERTSTVSPGRSATCFSTSYALPGATRNQPPSARMAPMLVDDRPPAPDIERIAESILDGTFERACGVEVK